MNEELEYSLKKLTKALTRLREAVDAPPSDLQGDAVIQRFEFTFELLWKTLKLFLREKGIEVRTPKDALKEAFRVGWLMEEGTFLQMLDDRNMSAHVYVESTAREIFERIKNKYLDVLAQVIIGVNSP